MAIRPPFTQGTYERHPEKWRPPKPDPNAPTAQQLNTEMCERFTPGIPEHVPFPPGGWLEYDIALEQLMRANGTSDRVVAQGWVTALLRAGRLDRQEGRVRLFPPEERAEHIAAERRRKHLEELRRDLDEIGGGT